MSNPGDFRIELADAKSGGVSDPRNGALMKMFNLIDVGERADYQTDVFAESHNIIDAVIADRR